MGYPVYPNSKAIMGMSDAYDKQAASGFSETPNQGGDGPTRLYYSLLDMGYPPEIAMEKAFPTGGGGMTAEQYQALGFSPEQARRAAMAGALAGADLPAGFINDLMGDGGIGGGGGGGGVYHPPAPQAEVDPRTGELILIGPDGSVTRTGEQIGFAGVDPRAEYEEGARRADNTNTLGAAGLADSAAQWRSVLGEDAAMNRAGFRERGTMDRAQLRETGAMSRAQLDENARQADTGFALDEFKTRANLVPALGDIALRTSQQQREILSEGSDYLARAYGQANQDSPLGLVTQADMSNKLLSNIAALDGLIPQARVTGRQTYRGAPGMEIPGFDDAPAFVAPGAFTAPTFRGFNPLAAPPALGPRQAYQGGGAVAYGGGGGGGFTASEMQNVAPQWPDIDPWESHVSPTNYRTNLPQPANEMPARMSDRAANASAGPGGSAVNAAAAPGFQWPSDEEAMGAQRGEMTPNYDWRKPADPLATAGGALARWIGGAFKPVPRYKDGTPSQGFTTEPAFIVNESGPELIENLDGGRIRVHDAKATKKMVPGFDEGTSGGYPLSRGQRTKLRTDIEMDALRREDPGMMAAAMFSPAGEAGAARGLMGLLGRGRGASAGRNEFAKDLAVHARAAGQKIGERMDYHPGSLGKPRLPRFESGTYGFSDPWNGNFRPNSYGGLNFAGAAPEGYGQYAAQPKPSNRSSSLGGSFNGPDLGGSYNGWAGGANAQVPYGFTDNRGNNARDNDINNQRYMGQANNGGNDPWNNWMRPEFNRAQPKMMTQEELQAEALDKAPPRVRAVFEGRAPDPAFIGAGLGENFRAPTARMLSQLGEDDLGALKTLTNVRSSGKTTLEDLMRQAGYMASPSGGGGSRRARVRGLGI